MAEVVEEAKVIKLAYKVFGVDGKDQPIEFKICNISSFCLYALQAVCSSILLYKLVRNDPKKRRSKLMILSTALLLYSSVMLAFLFGYDKLAIEAQQAGSSICLRCYLILCRDLPFTLVFIAHQIILS